MAPVHCSRLVINKINTTFQFPLYVADRPSIQAITKEARIFADQNVYFSAIEPQKRELGSEIPLGLHEVLYGLLHQQRESPGRSNLFYSMRRLDYQTFLPRWQITTIITGIIAVSFCPSSTLAPYTRGRLSVFDLVVRASSYATHSHIFRICSC